MPTYDYVCDACGHAFEEFQAFKDEQLTKCPACKKKKLRRLFGIGAAILFKGSGFYETDYRSESYKSAAKADQDAAKPAEPSKEGKGESGKEGKNGATGSEAAKPTKKSEEKSSPKSK